MRVIVWVYHTTQHQTTWLRRTNKQFRHNMALEFLAALFRSDKVCLTHIFQALFPNLNTSKPNFSSDTSHLLRVHVPRNTFCMLHTPVIALLSHEFFTNLHVKKGGKVNCKIETIQALCKLSLQQAYSAFFWHERRSRSYITL